MPEKTFGPGDIVELKSGGPPMTVTNAEDDVIEATWFTGAGEHRAGNFDPAVLQKVEGPRPPRVTVAQ